MCLEPIYKVKLADVCEILDNKRIPITASDRKTGIYPYYGANGVQDYVDGYIFDEDLVLLAEDGGNFGSKDKPIAYRVSGKCWVNNHAHVLRPLKNIDVDYLCYSLMFYDVNKLVNGATRKKLNKSEMLKMEVPLLELEEQRQIVKKIKRLENIIESRKKQVDLLDLLIKSRFIEMFGDFKRNVHGYPTCNIGVVAKLQGGYAFKSNDFIDYGVRLVQIGNVNKDNLDWNTNICLPENFLIKYKAFSLREDDIVMALTRPIIKSLSAVKIAVVGKNDLPSLLNQRVGRFVVNEKLINRTYLMYLCRMEDFKNYVESMSGNSLQPNISSNQVENYNILLPPLELQNQFADFVEQVNKSKFTHCYELLLLIIKKIWYNNYV